MLLDLESAHTSSRPDEVKRRRRPGRRTSGTCCPGASDVAVALTKATVVRLELNTTSAAPDATCPAVDVLTELRTGPDTADAVATDPATEIDTDVADAW